MLRATAVNVERFFPRDGEMASLRYQIMGVVNGVDIRVPFTTIDEAKRYAWERGWRVLDGITLRS